MTTLLSFLFVLGVLIFVHELGHFLAARRLGVRVLTFSLGFGPKLFTVKRGDTDYCISLIPLGGYVKMAGDTVEDSLAGKPDEFMSKTKWERFQILIAGPVMNILLAFVVTTVVLLQGTEVPAFEEETPVLGGVIAGSPAAKAGLQRGDTILTAAGEKVATWNALNLAIAIRPAKNVTLTVDRAGQPVTVTLQTTAETKYQIGSIGVLPDINPIIRSAIPGDPADKAGLKAGDAVVAVDGERVVLSSDLVREVSKRGGKTIAITIRRDGQELQIPVTPVFRDNRGMIGVTTSEATRSFQPGPLQAISLSAQRTVEGSGLIFKTIGMLLSGDASPKQLMGPVAIAQLSGESAQAGWVALFALMSMVSLNLGVLNLMPIPVLDGGHILILLLEGVARRDFSARVKERMLTAGFVVLMTLMVTVIYNDLARISWIEGLMPWRN
ncbi:MAG: RIP metalloprotease RseP [Vicinamibacterales bacterium]